MTYGYNIPITLPIHNAHRSQPNENCNKNAKKKIQEIINKAVLITVFENGEMDTRNDAVDASELKDVINSPCWYEGLQIWDREDGSFHFSVISRCWHFTVYHSWETVEQNLTPEAFNKYRLQAA